MQYHAASNRRLVTPRGTVLHRHLHCSLRIHDFVFAGAPLTIGPRLPQSRFCAYYVVSLVGQCHDTSGCGLSAPPLSHKPWASGCIVSFTRMCSHGFPHPDNTFTHHAYQPPSAFRHVSGAKQGSHMCGGADCTQNMLTRSGSALRFRRTNRFSLSMIRVEIRCGYPPTFAVKTLGLESSTAIRAR